MSNKTHPTQRQVAAVCKSIKADYGVMSDPDRAKLNGECIEWWSAIVKELRDPSNHFVVNSLCGPSAPNVPEYVSGTGGEAVSPAEDLLDQLRDTIARQAAFIAELEAKLGRSVAEVYHHGKDSRGRPWNGVHCYDTNVVVPNGTKLCTALPVPPAPSEQNGWQLVADVIAAGQQHGKHWLALKNGQVTHGEYEWRQGSNPDGWNTPGGRLGVDWITHCMLYELPRHPLASESGVDV